MIIAHEHIHKIRLKEIIFVLVVAFLISLLLLLNNYLFTDSVLFIIALVLLIIGMNLVVYVTQKSGIATLFFIFTSFGTIFINDLGILGWRKIIVFLIATFIFELFFLILKFHPHNIQLDVILGSSFAITSIPLVAAFLLSPGLASNFPTILLNIIVLAFFVGLVAAFTTFLIWHSLESKKFILKLKSYLMDLH